MAVDVQKVRQVPIGQVAERLGLTLRNRHTVCPFHQEICPSMIIGGKYNTYRCFGCGAHGDAISLVMRVQGLSFVDACNWILMESQGTCPSDPPSDPLANTIDLAHLESLVANPVLTPDARRFLYEERRIDPGVVRSMGISSIWHDVPMRGDGYGGWFLAPALLIPYRDIDGRLVSVQSRYLGSDGKPRFLFPKGSRCHIYNIQTVRKVGRKEPLYITEGVTDCLAMLSFGRKAIAIPSATLFKEDDIAPLRGLNLHICPDQDAPGRQLYRQLRDALARLDTGLVCHQLPQGVRDFGEWYKLNFK